jgi:hypothetical protein
MKQITYFLAVIFGALLFISCTLNQRSERNNVSSTSLPDSVYAMQAERLVALTFDTLRNSLLEAIRTRSLAGAIGFCNEKAPGITSIYTDSVTIRRTALRFRSQTNKPDSLEMVVLMEMEAVLQSGKVALPKIVRTQLPNEVHFFKPIIMQPMCLNCHGKPLKEINQLTMSSIQALYPDDRAVNFNTGDLRGVWHVVYKER